MLKSNEVFIPRLFSNESNGQHHTAYALVASFSLCTQSFCGKCFVRREIVRFVNIFEKSSKIMFIRYVSSMPCIARCSRCHSHSKLLCETEILYNLSIGIFYRILSLKIQRKNTNIFREKSKNAYKQMFV